MVFLRPRTNPVRKLQLGAAIALLSLMSFTTLLAGDIYVDGTSGNDGNSGAIGSPKATIGAGVTASVAGDVVHIAASTYVLSSTVVVNKMNLTLVGAGSATTIVQTSGTSNAFNIGASGVTIQDLTIQKTDLLTQSLILISGNNATIKNNVMFGPAPSPSYMTTSGVVTRALEVAGSLTGLLIDNNTIHTLRQPAYFSPLTVGTVSNNFVYGTKGWVVDGANITFTNNSWGNGTSGPTPANRFDIAILAGTNAAWYTDIVALSNANNIAQIIDQRSSPSLLSIAFVDPNSLATPRDGSPYYPFLSSTEANASLAPGGTIFFGDTRLPVELASFEVSSSNGLVYLDWRTASEVDNGGFEVYRASQGDTTFKIIASYLTNPGLLGHGTTSQGQRYNLVDGGDGALHVGESYSYRLIDVATDGTRHQHDPRTVMVDGSTSTANYDFFRLYPISPNPSTGGINISFSLADAGAVRIEVLNIEGRIMMVPVDGKEYAAGEFSESVSTSGLSAGNYMIRMIAGDRISTRLLTVIR